MLSHRGAPDHQPPVHGLMATHDNTARRPRRQRLTDEIVRKLPVNRLRIFYDGGPDHLAGFGIRVSPGCKSWVLNFVNAGQERRLTLGRWPTWDARTARAEAQRLSAKSPADMIRRPHARPSARRRRWAS